jgi:hypothetical protein
MDFPLQIAIQSPPSDIGTFRAAATCFAKQTRVSAVFDLLGKVPPALKSLWNMENELRSALQNAIFMRKEEASEHMAEAKKHWWDALHGKAQDEKPAAAASDPAPKEHLPYGEGPREQYGEGYKYRREDLSRGADESTSSDWAGGDHSEDEAGIPETAPIKKKPKTN